MDILFLDAGAGRTAAQEGAPSDPAVLRELEDTLGQLKQALHDTLLGSRSGSKEARQWLINSLAGLDIQDAAIKRRRFTQFLPGGGACRGEEHRALARAMLQLLFEAAPAEVGALLAQDASLLRQFFKSDPKRVPLWFGHFSMEGLRGFKFGAAALAQYALAHRDEVWHLLRWQGRHPQAPVAVARRPHYFCELDVPRTLRHLLRDCPAFWSSREMRQSVEAGAAQLLALAPDFWSKELLLWLEDRRSASGDRLYAALCRRMEEGPWSQHCQRLVQVLPQRDLLPLAAGLLQGSRPPAGGPAAAPGSSITAQPAAWLVFSGEAWPSLDRLLLAAALGCRLPLLLRLLRDEEMADEQRQVDCLVRQLLQLGRSPERQAAMVVAHWRLRRQLRRQCSIPELQEMLLLHLFAAAYVVQSDSSGSREAADQLQRLLTASSLDCQLVERAKARATRSSGGREGKKRRHSSRKSGKKRKKRRRSRDSSSGSDAGSGSSGDEAAGGDGASGEGRLGDEPSSGQPRWRWRVVPPSGGGSSPGDIGSLELLDMVTHTVAMAYVGWLLGPVR